jgi:acetyl esterase/lipase
MLLILIGSIIFITDALQESKKENEESTESYRSVRDFTPFLEGIKYGEHDRNTLDFYKSGSEQPTSVVIFFHGGGFVGGDRDAIREKGNTASFLEDCLNAGISVVSADYRLIQDAPFPAAMMDGARVIQFVKSMASKWNINPDKVALSGSSAGANMCIWLAMKGELANDDSEDPLERISTLIKCVVAYNAQTSNDPDFIYEHIYRGSQSHPSTLGFYGISSLDELQTVENKQKIYEASAINFVTQDDPPVFLDYNGDLTPTPLPEDTDMGIIIHHPIFGKVFKDKMDEAGVECVFHYKSNPTGAGEEVQFLLSHL